MTRCSMQTRTKQEKDKRAHAWHMLMTSKKIDRRNGNLQKRIPGNLVRGATGHNTLPPYV